MKQVQSAISQLEAATDGKGATTEDLQAASKALAAGTAQMKAALGTEEVKSLMSQVNSMVTTGNTLMKETKTLSETYGRYRKTTYNNRPDITEYAGILEKYRCKLDSMTECYKNINEVVASDNQTIKCKDSSEEQFRFYCSIHKNTGSKVCRNLR